MKVVYNNNYQIHGLDINLAIFATGVCTSLSIDAFGVSDIIDPIVFQLPQEYAPTCNQRSIGFSELDVLIRTDGNIIISCGKGQQIGSSALYSRGELGITFLHF